MAKFRRQVVSLSANEGLGAGRFGEDCTAAGGPLARLDAGTLCYLAVRKRSASAKREGKSSLVST